MKILSTQRICGLEFLLLAFLTPLFTKLFEAENEG